MRFGNWGADGTVPGSPIRQEAALAHPCATRHLHILVHCELAARAARSEGPSTWMCEPNPAKFQNLPYQILQPLTKLRG